jgi:hypothetical protein
LPLNIFKSNIKIWRAFCEGLYFYQADFSSTKRTNLCEVIFYYFRRAILRGDRAVAIVNQINLKPHFRKEGTTLPCDGEAGDLYVFTPLDEGAPDTSDTGVAELYFCTKGSQSDGRHAIWVLVHLDSFLTCADPVPKPPTYPKHKEG